MWPKVDVDMNQTSALGQIADFRSLSGNQDIHIYVRS